MNNNYKGTLNLPKTLFPMKANLVVKELNILKKWKRENIYKIIKNSRKNENIFLLHDGPPYANGDIHMGHVLNKILKDFILKSKNLSNMNISYIMGWDCHGLPIESKIKNKKIKINYNKFILKCRKYVKKQVIRQKKDFIRLGIFSDIKNSYLTMNNKTQANILRILGEFIKLKYIKNKSKPIYWCISCISNLSESEIVYKYIKSISLYLKFYIKNIIKLNNIFNINFIKNNKCSFIVWTTTPWTLIDNQAISIHPDIYYSLIYIDNEYIILSSKLINKILDNNYKNNYKVIDNIIGNKIINILCISPISLKLIPVILDSNIDYYIGTGIVHIAPGHGQIDYEIGIKNNLKIKNSINKYGIINNKNFIFNKNNVFKIIKYIINFLKINKLLFNLEKYYHKYPYCYRHNVKIIFRITNQWFIDLNKNNLRERSINEIKNIKCIPKWGKESIIKMLKERPDWCISRQRKWGIPIAVFINKKNELHPDTINLINKISNLIEIYGVEIWNKINLYKLTNIIDNNYKKVNDVLDVWFDSGTTFFSVIKKTNELKNKNYSDLCIEGSDQYRGWFMSSLLISVALNNKAPYKKILTHGFITDKYGNKMSKTIGNVIKPKEILKKFGCDIIRLWIASSNYKKNINISENVLNKVSDLYKKIRNTIRFLLSNIYDFDINSDLINFKNMLEIDIWILNKTYEIQKKIIYLYNSYKFNKVIELINKYCIYYISSNYLEIIKDRQYTSKYNSLQRRSCQTSIYYILKSLVIWISPILPFTSDEIWSFIPGEKNTSIFTEKWFDKLKIFNKNNIINIKSWELIFKIKSEVNKEIEIIKNKINLKSSLELHIFLYLKNNLLNKLKFIKKEIHYIFITSYVSIDKYINSPSNINDNNNIKGLKIYIKKINDGIKCNRCWHFICLKEKYTNDKYNFICNRCINNINNKYKLVRKYA